MDCVNTIRKTTVWDDPWDRWPGVGPPNPLHFSWAKEAPNLDCIMLLPVSGPVLAVNLLRTAQKTSSKLSAPSARTNSEWVRTRFMAQTGPKPSAEARPRDRKHY